MKRDERILWLQILGVVLCCVVFAWLIGLDRIVSGSDMVRDRLLLGQPR